jgi:hypothetical protein
MKTRILLGIFICKFAGFTLLAENQTLDPVPFHKV